MITLSFFAVPELLSVIGMDYHEWASPVPYYFFWSNFYILKYGFPYSPVLAVLWSVSVEEQFYIGWPWLLRLFKKQRIILFLLIILFSIGAREYFNDNGKQLFFNTLCIMSDFAIGAFIASMAVNRNAWFLRMKKLSRPIVILFYAVILTMVLFYHPLFDSAIATTVERLVLGIAFGWVIFDQAFSENRAFNFQKIPGFMWLGKRTYGLYCFHEVGIIVSIKLLTALHSISTPLQYALLMPLLAFMITVFLAALSYRYFEKPFLDWKNRYTVV